MQQVGDTLRNRWASLTERSTQSAGNADANIHTGARKHRVCNGAIQGTEGGPSGDRVHDGKHPPYLLDQGADVSFSTSCFPGVSNAGVG